MSWKTSPAASVDRSRRGEAAFPLDGLRAEDILARMGLVADSGRSGAPDDPLMELSLGRTDPDDPRGSRPRDDDWPTNRII